MYKVLPSFCTVGNFCNKNIIKILSAPRQSPLRKTTYLSEKASSKETQMQPTTQIAAIH